MDEANNRNHVVENKESSQFSNGARIPWWQPQVENEDLEFVKGAFERNYVNEGVLASEFEKKIAELVGARYAVATTSGTVSIFLVLKALGVGSGDEVIVPDATFIATANAAELCGARPVFVDINERDLNISTEAFERAITSKTKAVVPVHVTGRACDMETILDIARKNKIFVVEDAAEALGSKYKGKFLGTWGDAGCFSFSANKTISTAQGGMIVTNNGALASKIRALKDQGRTIKGTGGDDLHSSVGYNFKYTDIQAALGLGQLTHFERRAARMKRNYKMYSDNLKNIKDVRVFPSNPEELPQWTDIICPRRDELAEHLKKQNIDCRKYWHPIHKQSAYPQPDDKFPVSTRVLPKSLWLPSAFTLTDEDVNFVSNEIKSFFAPKIKSI
ncbi:DegT/DnrJ/EryC1/StrS family aminotransferase [Candidatus Giovannonibacteria bacterium]|nr:DegT/DnrJ/EryC1/StrS family aminotransferase [Candidatus Giovannonibacteria bacterium]